MFTLRILPRAKEVDMSGFINHLYQYGLAK